MRAVIQRVKHAEVSVEGQVCGKIDQGLLILLGIAQDDKPEDTLWLVKKIANLRIFADSEGKMNLSLQDVQGQALVVSQFTLYGNCIRGRRPDFLESAPPNVAEAIYNQFIEDFRKEGIKVSTGIFGAYMQVSLVNDGPVTFILDDKAIKQNKI